MNRIVKSWLIAAMLSAVTFARADEPQSNASNGESNEDNETELVKKLQNPVANLISLPLQNNWEFGRGSNNSMRYVVNVQPVIPFSLNDDWNLVVRTILPINHVESPIPGGRDVGGLGDTVQSFFFSPTQPVGGWVMGAGPVFLYPSASDNALGTQKWGAGPTAVFLKQTKGWTTGLLSNHIWSFAGPSTRQEVSSTFLQPFLSYSTQSFTTFSINTESTYDWVNHQWTVPINFSVSQMVKFGNQPTQFALGSSYYAEKPQGGPDWGLRFVVTFLYPK